MLVTPRFESIPPHEKEILSIAGTGVFWEPVCIGQGIYEISHFNFNMHLPRGIDPHAEIIPWGYPHYISTSGVCDNFEQILSKCPFLATAKDRYFVISLSKVTKADQPRKGGWRWHKWGEYIGTFESKCEYIYDEVGIDYVYCYHIYELKKGQFI